MGRRLSSPGRFGKALGPGEGADQLERTGMSNGEPVKGATDNGRAR